MATFYTIEVAYNSTHGKAEVGKKLQAVVGEIRANPQRIVDEVCRLDPSIHGDDIESFAESYRASTKDLTCRIVEDEETKLPRIHSCASGGGTSREIKEACRRAFARLVLAEMHRAHMDVSLIVS